RQLPLVFDHEDSQGCFSLYGPARQREIEAGGEERRENVNIRPCSRWRHAAVSRARSNNGSRRAGKLSLGRRWAPVAWFTSCRPPSITRTSLPSRATIARRRSGDRWDSE